MKLPGPSRTWIALGAAIVAVAVPTSALASWTVQSSTVPTGAKESHLYSVSCYYGEVFCRAVGSYVNSSGTQKLLAEVNEAPWEPELPPNPSGTDPELFDISCVPSELYVCMAVGREKEGGVPKAIALKYSHGTIPEWELQTLPFPPGNTASELGAVSCPSATECMATGDFHNSTGEHNLAEHWTSSGGWAAAEPPTLPEGGYPALSGVSCPEVGKCLAVGEYRNSKEVELTQSDEFSGGSWASAIAMSHLAGASGMVGAADSCVTISACMAVGYYTSGGTILTLGDEWEPSAWTLQSTKNVTGASDELKGTSCPEKVGECIATGISTKSGVASGLGEEYKSGAWGFLTMASPAGAKSTSLYRVSCEPKLHCFTVGSYVNSSGETQILVEEN